MNGYAFCFGTCLTCRESFGFNPRKVPSLTVDGERQPVCGSCMALANARRVAAGMPPHPIEPDAYEPIAESEL